MLFRSLVSQYLMLSSTLSQYFVLLLVLHILSVNQLILRRRISISYIICLALVCACIFDNYSGYCQFRKLSNILNISCYILCESNLRVSCNGLLPLFSIASAIQFLVLLTLTSDVIFPCMPSSLHKQQLLLSADVPNFLPVNRDRKSVVRERVLYTV